MATNVSVSGVTYSVPDYGDTGWGQGTQSVNKLLIALAAVAGQANPFVQFTLVLSTTTVLNTRTMLVDTSSGPITLNLPAPVANFWFIVKDKKGTSVMNPITLHLFGSEMIDGSSVDATLAAPFGSWTFFSDGTDWYSVNYV